MDKKLIPKVNNPGFKEHGITIPARILVVGASGSMKTNCVLNLVKLMKNTFEEIIVFCRDRDEPLYNHLSSKVHGDQIRFIEVKNGSKIPTCKEIGADKKQRLVIFDDLCLLPKREQVPISEFFTTGRKFLMTTIYITQSYFETPKTIRSQCNYLFLKKIRGEGDLKMILREYKLGLKIKDLMLYYKYAIRDEESFLLIDLQTNTENKMFRKNFDDYFCVPKIDYLNDDVRNYDKYSYDDHDDNYHGYDEFD